ncbi:MAG: RagB/SusD family nutrient uptake outer membrane protein [Bacteroidales bacterium]|nr:RagB/SusD family nutrient uptake outer membrane protein [Bacteroidales bacterium]
MKKIAAILAAIFSLVSCESFLDMAPDENLTLDDVFVNRLYTRAFLNNVYSYCPYQADMNWDNNYTGACDEMEIAYGAHTTHDMCSGAWDPTSGFVGAIWTDMYAGIRKANQFLENIDKCTDAEPAVIRRWKGEAYFLRAFYHFLIFKAYGPIPIADHALDITEDLNAIVRQPADDVIDFIVDDCDRAAEALVDMDVWSTNDTGRATRIAALALKSRALLYIASPLYNGNPMLADLKDPATGKNLISQTYDPEKWKRAADAAKDCIDAAIAAGHKLYDNELAVDPVTNYQNIFNVNWNEEVLWGRNNANGDHWLNCSDPTSFGCYAIFDPTQELVDAYEMEDGSTPITGYKDNGLTPIINPDSGYEDSGFSTDSYPNRWNVNVCKMYTHREPRFYASINFAGAVWKTTRASNWTTPHVNEFWYNGIDGKGNAGSDYCKTGYLMKKLHYPTRIPWQYTPNQVWIYIRLGEIYLNYAEALNEYSGPVPDVYTYVNAIRTRAALPGLASGLDKDQMRERIHHERRIELAFETHRWSDVRRWLEGETQGQPIHSMNIWEGISQTDPAFYKRFFVENRVFESPKHYFYPIPQSEIDKNAKHLLVQNLGWITETAGVPE